MRAKRNWRSGHRALRRAGWIAAAVTAAFFMQGRPAHAADTDADGLEDWEESVLGTNPSAADSDGDGRTDHQEVRLDGTDPLMADSDGDGTGDATDTAPMRGTTTLPDGGAAATFSGGRSGMPWAPSGESPRDGIGVHVHDGSVHYRLDTAHAKGVGCLAMLLQLRYDSQSTWDGYHGMGWTSILDTQRTVDPAGNVNVFWNGAHAMWIKSGAVWMPPPGFFGWLTEDPTDFHWITWPNGESFCIGPQGITKHQDRDGNQITYDYPPAAAHPATITDARGEVHTLTYYPATNRLHKVTMADGAVWRFEYNCRGQLDAIVGPATTSFGSGITHRFRYLNGSSTGALNGNLVAASDGKSQWWLHNEYDGSDRVLRQVVGAGTDAFAFDWTSWSSQQTTVTDRAGNERVWKWHATKLTRSELTERTNRGVRSGEGDYTTTWTHDADGFLASVTYPEGNGIKWTRNAAKQATERRRKADMSAADDDDEDVVYSWEYDSSKFWGTTKYTDPLGNETNYTLDSQGRPTEIAFPAVTNTTPDQEVTHEYSYNSDGSIDTFTDGAGSVTKYEYFTTGAKTGRLKKRIRDYGGLDLTTEWDYEAWGDVRTCTDAGGNVTTYTHERYGNLTKVEFPSSLGYVTEHVYDLNLNVVETRVKNVDHDGSVSGTNPWLSASRTFDAMDNLTSLTEEIDSTASRVTSYEYDANENLVKTTRHGRETRWVHDERDLVHTRSQEGGASADRTWEWTYDGNRNVVDAESPLGRHTTYAYDGFDRTTQVTDALGHYALIEYDRAGRETQREWYGEAGSADVLLAARRQEYDEMGRLFKTEDALIGSSSTSWLARTSLLDERGLTVEFRNRKDGATTFEYDDAGRLVSQTDPLGNVVAYTLDAAGNVLASAETEKIPGSSSTETYVTQYQYDALHRMSQRAVVDRANPSNSLVTQWKRGVLGLRVVTDPRGYDCTLTLDGLGRVTAKSEELASGSIDTLFTLDADGRVTSATDDASNVTTWEYDVFGDLSKTTFDDTTTVQYGRNSDGEVISIVDQNGTVATQARDAMGRVTSRNFNLGTGVGGVTSEQFTYDALGRLVQAKNDDSIVEFTYDSLSRPLTEKQGDNPFGASAKTTTYTWDDESFRASVTYPSGFVANEVRDVLGRLVSVDDGSSNEIAAFDLYGAGGRTLQIGFGNGTKTEFEYDGYRRVADIAHKSSGGTPFAGFAYAYDANGNPLAETRSHQGGKGDVYTYDPANRLTKVLEGCDDPAAELASPGSQTYDDKVEFNLDDVHNLTSRVETPYGGSASTTSFSADSMNRYTSVGSVTHTYTPAGALADDGTFEYVYDAHERLIEVRDSSTSNVVAEYQYDALGLGRRVRSIVGSTTTRYVYAADQAVEEYVGTSSTPERVFVFGDGTDRIVMMQAPDVADVDGDSDTAEILRFAMHRQLIGSVTQVTGPTGAVVESYEYDAFGATVIKDGSGSTISASAIGNPYLFSARQLDAESGLYYFRGRHYSPALARFIQRDPLGYVDSMNAYLYCHGSPTIMIDPFGLDDIPVTVTGSNGTVTVNVPPGGTVDPKFGPDGKLEGIDVRGPGSGGRRSGGDA